MTELAYIADATMAELVGNVDGLRVITADDAASPSKLESVSVFVPGFLAADDAVSVVERMPNLKLIQLATAGAEVWAGSVPSGVTLATARGAHGAATAEWAVGALLAVVRDFPRFTEAQRERRWDYHSTDLLAGKKAMVVGAGDLGERVRQRLLAFDVEVTMVARHARDGVHSIDEVTDLLPDHQVVVLVVPLSADTENLVDAAFLAALPDGAVLVNAARGKVVDTGALLAELVAGRLRAALDVTEPEPLPRDHPLWAAPGVFVTPHVGGSARGSSQRAAAVVREQLQRFASGQPVRYVVTEAGY